MTFDPRNNPDLVAWLTEGGREHLLSEQEFDEATFDRLVFQAKHQHPSRSPEWCQAWAAYVLLTDRKYKKAERV